MLRCTYPHLAQLHRTGNLQPTNVASINTKVDRTFISMTVDGNEIIHSYEDLKEDLNMKPRDESLFGITGQIIKIGGGSHVPPPPSKKCENDPIYFSNLVSKMSSFVLD